MATLSHEITCQLESLAQPTATGLMAMLCIAIREQSNLSAQIKEWGFTDIPHELVQEIDDLEDYEYLEICNHVGSVVLSKCAAVFKCDTCGQFKPWSMGAADAHPNTCDTCWTQAIREENHVKN